MAQDDYQEHGEASGTDEPGDRTGPDGQAHVAERGDTPEPLTEIAHLEEHD